MEQSATDLPHILTAHLFLPLEQMLIELLRSLRAADWEAQTIAPKWKVKDVAAHLLDTQLRKLSMVRDGYFSAAPVIASQADLVSFINRVNQEGVALYRRLSPEVLISLMEFASRASAEFHLSLDPFATAAFAVSWAGEDESLNWFDTARELTERWHHQQQIRLALDKPGIMKRQFYHPVLDCFLRALPYHYRNLPAASGTLVQFDIPGDCGGSWWLLRGETSWRLVASSPVEPVSKVIIPQELAWRLFTKGLDPAAAESQIRVEGNRELGSHVMHLTAIVG